VNLKDFVKERYGVVVLASVFMMCSVFILAHPHSFENATVPDEKSYYGWAKLYNEGIYEMPLYDWYGVQAGLDYYVNASGIHYLELQERLIQSGGGALSLEIRVTMQERGAVAGAQVHVFLQRTNIDLSGSTNSSGAILFSNLPKTSMSIAVHYITAPLGTQPAINLGAFAPFDTSGIGEPYQTRIDVVSYSSTGSQYELAIRLVDSLDDPVPGVNLTHIVRGGGQPQPIGMTDDYGAFTLTSTRQGSQSIIGEKDSRRGLAPIASVVPHGDGYVVVNHWAPGYSIILGILDKAHLADFTGVLMMGMALVATYMLARRLFGWKVAMVSGMLLLTCGVALLLIWTVGMADYASMAFALAGIWLLTGAFFRKRAWYLNIPLGFFGGAAFGASVWIRYSTASLLLAVAFLILAMSFKDWRELRARGKIALPIVKRFIARTVPFAAGLALLLLPLALYNSTYFGGPFGASHNYGGQISIDSSAGNISASVVTGSVYTNFDPIGSIPTMAVRLHWLFTVMPFLLLLPAALYIGWRRLPILFLFAWVLSNLLLYMFIPWVASWWEAARALEDTRYFLPAMPPAAMLGGLAITQCLMVPQRRRALGVIVLAFFVVAGFAIAQVGIDAQLERLTNQPGGGIGPSGPPNPPPTPEENYTLLTVKQLLGGPGVYSDTLAEVRNCTFDHWIDSTSFLFRDASSPVLLKVALLAGYTPPTPSPGTMFHVKGVFLWNDNNGDTIPQPQELLITVKAGTTDSIVLA
jgi:hypothetical protein